MKTFLTLHYKILLVIIEGARFQFVAFPTSNTYKTNVLLDICRFVPSWSDFGSSGGSNHSLPCPQKKEPTQYYYNSTLHIAFVPSAHLSLVQVVDFAVQQLSSSLLLLHITSTLVLRFLLVIPMMISHQDPHPPPGHVCIMGDIFGLLCFFLLLFAGDIPRSGGQEERQTHVKGGCQIREKGRRVVVGVISCCLYL